MLCDPVMTRSTTERVTGHNLVDVTRDPVVVIRERSRDHDRAGRGSGGAGSTSAHAAARTDNTRRPRATDRSTASSSHAR